MQLPDKVKSKLRELPAKPGVYVMRDRSGKVIYVGKAKSLRNRVRNYFQQSTLRSADPKIRGLIRSITDFDYIVVRNEADAILTEGRMIKEYRPYYNTLFKDDKRFILLRMNLNDPFPKLEIARLRKDDGAVYLGPYASGGAARTTRDFVERHFHLRRCRPLRPDANTHKHCLDDIISFCSAPCIGTISAEAYREQAREAVAFLRGERPEILQALHEEMEAAAAQHDFERAAQLRDTLLHLRRVIRQRATGKKDMKIRRDDADAGLAELQRVLGLPSIPRIIETFDISNTSGSQAVASMVCCVDGMPNRSRYRRFRIKWIEGPDDPGMIAEAAHRRYSRLLEEKKSLPDLVVFDGGITQLRAGRRALDDLGLQNLPAVGLAKRFEEIVWDISNVEPPHRLDDDSPGLRILKGIRDEAHRFALTYHRSLRDKRIKESMLDDIPGIGTRRKQILLQHFGSVQRMRNASIEEITCVPGIGVSFAQLLHEALKKHD